MRTSPAPRGWRLVCPNCHQAGGKHAGNCESIAIPRIIKRRIITLRVVIGGYPLLVAVAFGVILALFTANPWWAVAVSALLVWAALDRVMRAGPS